MDEFLQGLRAQDVNAGLRNLHPSDAVLGDLAETQRVGMAAGVASLVRGREVIEDAQNLRAIVADQLDIPPLTFDTVVTTLEEAGMVNDVKRARNRITSFSENVPYYSDLYQKLGATWRAADPTELEQQVVLIVDALAQAPIARDEIIDKLALDTADFDVLVEVTTSTDLVQSISVGSDQILYSPFLGFEQPQLIADIVIDHGTIELSDAFSRVREHQGLPVSQAGAVVEDAVSRGLLIAPSVQLPSGEFESFATLPYSADVNLLKARKPVLEKALAVVACLRTAQYFGGYSNLTPTALVYSIDKLLRDGFIKPHSSSERQYRLLLHAGVIRYGKDLRAGGKWITPTLIDTEDNRDALKLAKDLIVHGELLESRTANQPAALKLLNSDDRFAAPLKTVSRLRDKRNLTDRQWQTAIDKLMGHTST